MGCVREGVEWSPNMSGDLRTLGKWILMRREQLPLYLAPFLLLGLDILPRSIIFRSRGKFCAKISVVRTLAATTVFSRQNYASDHMHTRFLGRSPFNQIFLNFRNGEKWWGNFLWKFRENPKIVEFPKCEPINRKFPGAKSNGAEMSEISGKKFSNYVGIPREDVLNSKNSGKCCFIRHKKFLWNSKRNFWSNGKRRCTHSKICIRILLNKLLSNYFCYFTAFLQTGWILFSTREVLLGWHYRCG